MGSFEEDKDIIKQNLECVTERPDAVFGIRMLMEDKCEMPDREMVQDVMDRHLGRSECFCYDAQVIGFSASQYSVHFAKENKDISPQLLIMGCKPITAPVMDGMEKSQTWDCPECDDILQQCTWQVAASDMMAAGLNYKERAEMLVQYVEALMELFPSCRAVAASATCLASRAASRISRSSASMSSGSPRSTSRPTTTTATTSPTTAPS